MRTLLALILIALSNTACAPMTEAQREAREYERIEFKEQFIVDRKLCFASGRMIHIHANAATLDHDGVPKSRVNYVCA